MGNRLSKIVTRTGDAGTTGLADGSRLGKTEPRVHALGEVDELNCLIGVVLTCDLTEAIRGPLERVQNELFDLGGELSLPGHSLVKESYLQRLEDDFAVLNKTLPPLKEFVLPGGNPAAAHMHLARAVCRRAERAVWAGLPQAEAENSLAPKYLNRLSDFLFSAARILARSDGGEISWKRSD